MPVVAGAVAVAAAAVTGGEEPGRARAAGSSGVAALVLPASWSTGTETSRSVTALDGSAAPEPSTTGDLAPDPSVSADAPSAASTTNSTDGLGIAEGTAVVVVTIVVTGTGAAGTSVVDGAGSPTAFVPVASVEVPWSTWAFT